MEFSCTAFGPSNPDGTTTAFVIDKADNQNDHPFLVRIESTNAPVMFRALVQAQAQAQMH